MHLLGLIPDTLPKTGWPWNEETDPSIYKDGNWPKISIITASYNQGMYIEETIRSILLQNYPNIEYIIIDGGSTDDSVNIIKKYEKWLTYWVSEKDDGQAHAINKGIELISGDVFNYINSDDYLAKDALYNIARSAKGNVGIIAGKVNNFFDDDNCKIENYTGEITTGYLSFKEYFALKSRFYFHQPGIWYSKKLLGNHRLDQNLHYCFDTKLILELLESSPNVCYINYVLVNFRLHNQSKTINYQDNFKSEYVEIHKEYLAHKNLTLAAIAKASFERKKWMASLTDLQSLQGSKVKKISFILKVIFQNPLKRFNRYSMGCIKKILLS